MTIAPATDAEIDAAIAAGKNGPNYALATAAAYIADTDQIAVIFDNGIEVRFPRLSMPELADKTPEQIGRSTSPTVARVVNCSVIL
jgi:hypothetical protein